MAVPPRSLLARVSGGGPFGGLLLLLVLLTPAPASPPAPPRTIESETALFFTMDLNHDGLVTFAEYYARMWTDTPGDLRFLDLAREHFDSLDQDGDGVLTLEECLAPIREKEKGKPR